MNIFNWFKPFSYLYDKMLLWAAHHRAPYYLAGISFAESSFFPIPPDVMLISMGLAKPHRSWHFAGITTVCSVLGGILGYLIGMYGMSVLEPILLASSYATSYQKIRLLFEHSGIMTVILASFTPFPYKIFTITAGALKISFLPFVLGSLLGRGLRFYLVSGLLYWKGAQLEKRLRRMADNLGWILLVGIVAFYLVGCGERTVLAPVVDSHWSPMNVYQKSHRVSRGETLYSIAFRYEKDYRQLALMNHIRSPYILHVGQVLQLRGVSSASTRIYSPVAAVKSNYVTHYTKTNAVKPVVAEKVWYVSPTQSKSRSWQWPAAGRITATFAPSMGRKGILIAGKAGEDIVAARNGTVAYAGSGISGYGQLILIKHDSQFLTAYGHNARILVREGQYVRKGQIIAKMGEVKRPLYGVHFEIRHAGVPINPINYL